MRPSLSLTPASRATRAGAELAGAGKAAAAARPPDRDRNLRRSIVIIKMLSQNFTGGFHLSSMVNLAVAARDCASLAVMVQPGGRLWPVGGLPMRI